jgi:heterodisulfide reductase subunit A-like polyferredoxin
VYRLASVLKVFVTENKVTRLVHNGEKIVNVLVANTLTLDVSDMKETELVILVPGKFLGKGKDKFVPLFSTF